MEKIASVIGNYLIKAFEYIKADIVADGVISFSSCHAKINYNHTL
jgi:hypothetical protein